MYHLDRLVSVCFRVVGCRCRLKKLCPPPLISAKRASTTSRWHDIAMLKSNKKTTIFQKQFIKDDIPRYFPFLFDGICLLVIRSGNQTFFKWAHCWLAVWWSHQQFIFAVGDFVGHLRWVWKNNQKTYSLSIPSTKWERLIKKVNSPVINRGS